jgi:hypothetical protein
MAYLLFIDESGQDRRRSPYEVLCGAAIHDTQLWDLVCDIQDAEIRYFGTRISNDRDELKARRLLKAKTIRLANQAAYIRNPQRAYLASRALLDGAHATREQITALAQAKLAFAEHVLEICATHGVRLFASVVHRDAPPPAGDLLRKDYAYLFERFYYFVNEQPNHERGLVVFDELGRSKSHVLVGQMSAYFRETERGRMRSGRIVPEPFFVHSDLTTGVQIADIAAYLLSWNVRFTAKMTEPRRVELNDLERRVMDLRHSATVEREGYPNGFVVWSFAFLDDLRPRSEKALADLVEEE